MKYAILSLAFIYHAISGYCQTNLKFEDITTEDGLASNFANYLHIDSYDYLWVGTIDGLNRYDGHEFKLYTESRSNSGLSNGYISYIYEDWDSTLWIGTMAGLNYYERLEDQIYELNFPNFLKVHEVSTILQVNDSTLLIGTTKGLFRYNKYTHSFSWDKYESHSLKDTVIICLFLDKKNENLWIGTRSAGMFLMEKESNKIVSLSDFSKKSFPSNEIRRIDQDANANLWIATYDNGVIWLNPKTFESKVYNKENSGLGNNFVFDVKCLSNGQVWATAINGYANLFNPETNRFFSFIPKENSPYSIKGHSVTSILEDKNKNIWFSTHGNGVEIVNRESQIFKYKIKDLNDRKSLNKEIVTKILEYGDNVWFCTDGGGLNVCKKDLNSDFMYITEKEGLGSNHIYDIELGSDGMLYAGAWQGGVSIIDPNTKKVVGALRGKETENGELSSDISRVLCVVDTLLWMGMHDKGINIYDMKNKKVINNSSPENRFFNLGKPTMTNSINSDSKGRLWFSTLHGLFLYDWKQLTEFLPDKSNDKSLFSENIIMVYEDSKQTIWVVTELGIGKFNESDSSFTHMNSKWNLPNNAKGFVEDKNGDFWVTTTSGLYRIKRNTGVAEVFTKKQGLLGDFYFTNTIHNLSNGDVFIGGTEGSNYFNPDDLLFDPIEKSVSLQTLYVDGVPAFPETNPDISDKVIEFSDTITLNDSYDEFQIHYSLVCPGSNRTITYAVRLVGFNEDWRKVGNKTDVTYTNLDPGKYTFEVTTYDTDFGLNQNVRSLTIFILPPWYATLWSKLSIVLLMIFAIYGIFYLRLERIRQQNRLLEKKVKERTVELKKANDLLVHQNEQIVEQNHNLKEKGEEIEAQRNSLEELNKTKDKFFSIISHDLKNPLSAVMGFAELLDNSFDTFSEEKKRKFIKIISSSSKSLFALLENLLHWARSQSGTMLFKPEKIKLNGIICENIITLKHHAKKKLIDLEFNEENDFYLVADENMLSTVIRNLTSNAIKFTPTGGKISLNISEKENSIVVRVKDSGVGMTPEQIDKLFEIDKNKSTNGTDSETGTGLGLILCKEFVDKHNGKIWAESRLGQGSAFYVELPKILD